MLRSALATEGAFFDTERFLQWFEQKSRDTSWAVRQIPFAELDDWAFDPRTGNLGHRSGKFFTIHGISVQTNFPVPQAWQQPIIHQPEIGILGIITKEFEGIPHFLMQAKFEPGNVNGVQLSPTLQATKSNFSRVHKGKLPLYFEYFNDPDRGQVIVDQLQNEQGARYFNKRNRNVVIAVDDEVPVHDDFCWLTLGQLKRLLREDNLVNMDSRTVLSGIQYGGSLPSEPCCALQLRLFDTLREGFAKDLYGSLLPPGRERHRSEEIISWFTRQKSCCEVKVEQIPLREIDQWEKDAFEIRHASGHFFSVIAVDVQAGSREVPSWRQPLLKHFDYGLVGFLTARINGVLHFLVEAHMCPGYLDLVEMGPTVSCGEYAHRVEAGTTPPFADFFLQPDAAVVHFSAILSEEGGRFYHFQNRYMVVEIESAERVDLPDHYIWMTFGQLMEFIKHTNYVNIEARTLIACLGFV